MTNKPMLSVERDTLEWVLNCWPKEQKGNAQEVIPSQVKELRALLDRPETPYVPKAGWSFKYVENGVIIIRNGEDWTIIKPGDGPIYEQFLYRFCEEQLNKTAAQHHGDPVAWQYRVSAGPATGWILWHDGKGEEFKNSYQVETRPLYAEQPAPVADSTTSDKYRAELYDEVWQKARDMVFANVTDALDKMAAPVAVVMPEKKSVPEPEDYNTNIDEVAFAEGYNDALDDVARLNVVKP